MKISLAIPIHNMKRGDFFLRRLLQSLERQTYRNFEIVITTEGTGMAGNTNSAIQKCTGDIVKILYMDDYLAHPDSLKVIVDNFNGGWLATGCLHDDGTSVGSRHFPEWDDRIFQGINTIGSPSVVAIENGDPLMFDTKMSWLLDVDYYQRLFDRYGEPTLVNDLNVIMGIGDHQMTNILSLEEKQREEYYLKQKQL